MGRSLMGAIQLNRVSALSKPLLERGKPSFRDCSEERLEADVVDFACAFFERCSVPSRGNTKAGRAPITLGFCLGLAAFALGVFDSSGLSFRIEASIERPVKSVFESNLRRRASCI